MRRLFYYDIVIKDWVESEEKTDVCPAIEESPILVVVRRQEGTFLWQKEAKEYEEISELRGETALTVSGKSCHGLPMLMEISEDTAHGMHDKKAMLRWVVSCNEKTGIVTLLYEARLIRFFYDKEGDKLSKPHFGRSFEGNWSISYKNVSMKAFHGSEIPSVVAEAALEYLRGQAEKELGRKPSVLSKMTGVRKLEAFIHRPLDLNIWYLRPYIHDFERLFPRKQSDNFGRLCEYFGISHPPKSLRKAYTHHPFSVLIYVMLWQLGIRDINLMRPFLGETVFCGFDLGIQPNFSRAGCFPFLPQPQKADWNTMGVSRSEEIVQLMLDSVSKACFEKWEALAFYVKLLRERKPDSSVCKRLLKLQRDGWGRSQEDTLLLLKEFYEKLPVRLTEDLFQKGLTEEFHSKLVHFVNAMKLAEEYGEDYKNRLIEYTEEERGLEFCQGAYSVRLLRNAQEFMDIGRIMNNSVASYVLGAFNKKLTILVLEHDGRYEACIEILPLAESNYLNQLLGPSNKKIEGEPLEICRLWAEKKGIDAKGICA